MGGTLAPNAKFTGLDDEGVPLVGGLLWTYLAHTSTKAPTYSDVDLKIANSNPVELDAGGRATVFLDAATYKFILQDALGSEIWSQDDIASIGVAGVGGIAGIGEVFVFSGDSTAMIIDHAYVAGDTVATLHAGTGLLVIDSAQLVGVYALEGMLLAQGGTVRVAMMNLSDGDTDTPMVEIQSSSSDGERAVSEPIIWAPPGSPRTYGLKARVDAGAGWAWQLKLTRIEG